MLSLICRIPSLPSGVPQVAPEEHWPEMRVLIAVVSSGPKDVSSSAGMQTSVQTSDLLAHRAAAVVCDEGEISGSVVGGVWVDLAAWRIVLFFLVKCHHLPFPNVISQTC